MSTAGRPRVSTIEGPTFALTKFIDDNWDERVGRTNEDVASELGYKSPNMISMWRTGKTRIALERLPDVARLLRTDIAILMPLWLEQTYGERPDWPAMRDVFEKRFLTDGELNLMTAVRTAHKKRKGRDKSKDDYFTKETVQAVAKVIADPALVESILSNA